jgi:A/G-specific adenine glycosylase
MALLRRADAPVSVEDVLAAAAEGGVRDPEQPRRAYDSLIADGLVVEFGGGVRLP